MKKVCAKMIERMSAASKNGKRICLNLSVRLYEEPKLLEQCLVMRPVSSSMTQKKMLVSKTEESTSIKTEGQNHGHLSF
jgi:hypothetical protein